MESFDKLLGSLLSWVYHCFDRVVIQGSLPLLTRPEHMVLSSATCTASTPSPSRL